MEKQFVLYFLWMTSKTLSETSIRVGNGERSKENTKGDINIIYIDAGWKGRYKIRLINYTHTTGI